MTKSPLLHFNGQILDIAPSTEKHTASAQLINKQTQQSLATKPVTLTENDNDNEKKTIKHLKLILKETYELKKKSIDEQQAAVRALLEKDKANFHAAFSIKMTHKHGVGKPIDIQKPYTDDIEKIGALVSENSRSTAIQVFIEGHNTLLQEKLFLITMQITHAEGIIKTLQKDIEDKKQELETVVSKIKEIPKLSFIEQTHLAEKPTLLQRLVIQISKPFYSETHLQSVKQRQAKLDELKQHQQKIPTEIASSTAAIVKLNKDIADKRKEHIAMSQAIRRFATCIADAINSSYKKPKPKPEVGLAMVSVVEHVCKQRGNSWSVNRR